MMATQAAQNSMLHLILGGAALQRCDDCIVWTAALAAEVALSAVVTTLKVQR
jgi:hypothetical protein